MARVFVTGGSGFIGRHLVARLREQEHEVDCLVRDSSETRALQGVGINFVYGDLLAADSFREPISKADLVYHLAGVTIPPRDQDYFVTNAGGTKVVGELCAEADSPPTLVYVSSLAAAGPSPLDAPRDESIACAPVSAYGKSKREGEEQLRKVADRVPVSIVRPPGVFGPHEPFLPQFFEMARRGWCVVPGTGRDQYSFVYVDDLVEVIQLAANHGRRLVAEDDPEATGVYFAAQPELVTMSELAGLAAKILEQDRVRTLRIPISLCLLVGCGGQLARRLGFRPLLNWDKMREARAGSWTCSTNRIESEFGYEAPASLEDRLRTTIDWCLKSGRLKP